MTFDREMMGELIAGAVGAAIILLTTFAIAGYGWAAGWESGDPELEAWFQTSIVRRCCDLRDAYLADAIEDDGNGGYVAIITDGSADPRYDKPAVPNGTKIPVPPEKFMKPGAPGGRGVIFLQKTSPDVPPEKRWVFCYFPPPLF